MKFVLHLTEIEIEYIQAKNENFCGSNMEPIDEKQKELTSFLFFWGGAQLGCLEEHLLVQLSLLIEVCSILRHF